MHCTFCLTHSKYFLTYYYYYYYYYYYFLFFVCSFILFYCYSTNIMVKLEGARESAYLRQVNC